MSKQRNKVVFGNWKLNNDLTDTVEFCFQLRMYLSQTKNMERINDKRIIMGLAPQLPLLSTMMQHINEEVWTISQNVSIYSSGAYTGEISPTTLLSLGISTVLIGHSERRTYFNEIDEAVNIKTKNALNLGMNVVLCCGETKSLRDSGEHFDWIKKQLLIALRDVNIIKLRHLFIAYEPIWAIGTGQTATPQDAEKMCLLIRDFLQHAYTTEMSNRVHILYGGSVKPNNIKEICSMKNIDGVLVGGASVKAASYIKLLENC